MGAYKHDVVIVIKRARGLCFFHYMTFLRVFRTQTSAHLYKTCPMQVKKSQYSYIFHNKSRLKINTSKHGRLNSLLSLQQLLHQWLCIALGKLLAHYLSAMDGDHFCVSDYQVKL